MVDDHTMGDGRADLTAADIRSALRLYRVACLIEAAAVGMLALALWLSPS
jgi:adenosylcobinamide-phosphate synthase